MCDEVLAANPIVSDVVLCTSTSSRLARLVVELRQRVFVTRTVHCSTGLALLFGKPQRTFNGIIYRCNFRIMRKWNEKRKYVK